MLTLVIASVFLEWILYGVPMMWRGRRYVVVLPLIMTAFVATGVLMWRPGVLAALIAFLAVFRIFNLLRIAQNRMHATYLLKATRRTGTVLGVVQVILAVVNTHWVVRLGSVLTELAVLQMGVAALLFVSTLRTLQKSKHQPSRHHYADRDLPTVTVAIPARNETTDLEACLRSVLANTYPKFEVLVLDDCSQDKTSDIIKSFAHDGVRFIKGSEPGARWLAKNQAYDRLAHEATGELLLFCGVDVRFGPETIRALVTTLLDRKKDMISVMPRRLSSELSATLIQPLRYWWEVALPRRYFNRPPVLSTCWMIRRKTLQKLGGFAAVQHAIIPEGYFARELVMHDTYSFMRADDVLDVQTRKSLADQRATALRMRYPQIRRRPEVAAGLFLGHILFTLGPFAVLVSGFWYGFTAAHAAGAGAIVLLVLTHVMITQVTNPANVLVSVLSFPLAIVLELYMGGLSMYKYEFSAVEWKDRNICIPVMHVVPRMPPLPKSDH